MTTNLVEQLKSERATMLDRIAKLDDLISTYEPSFRSTAPEADLESAGKIAVVEQSLASIGPVSVKRYIYEILGIVDSDPGYKTAMKQINNAFQYLVRNGRAEAIRTPGERIRYGVVSSATDDAPAAPSSHLQIAA